MDQLTGYQQWAKTIYYLEVGKWLTYFAIMMLIKPEPQRPLKQTQMLCFIDDQVVLWHQTEASIT